MILTLEDFKNYPEYDSTKTDAQVQLMIDRAEADYLRLRGIPFRTLNVTIVDLSTSITANSADYRTHEDVTDLIQVGQPIYSADGQYGKVSAVSSTAITSDTASSGSADTTLYIYPLGARDTVAMMVKYAFLDKPAGVKSESIFKHSVTYADPSGGYPKDITGRIKRYASLKGGSVETSIGDVYGSYSPPQ